MSPRSPLPGGPQPDEDSLLLPFVRNGRDTTTPKGTPGQTVGGVAAAASGTGFAEKYTLLEQLPGGGMGIVWKAEERTEIRRKVALKLSKAGGDRTRATALFERERQILARMEHSSIVHVYGTGADDGGHPYLAMEWIEGGVPITTYCDAHSLSVTDRLALFLTLCRAVQHAHDKGGVHRDLKPANILVKIEDGKPVPMLIDFGVALSAGAAAGEVLLGTPAYMSPEQTDPGHPAYPSTDVYSLGGVVYELLTGTKPVADHRLPDGESLRGRAGQEELRHILQAELDPPSVRAATAGRLRGDSFSGR